ncbi:MAG: sigma 54-interacting transcriptional regulator [Deltaproteobacteria bacterium]|jgi:arginine utilization regulatory protein|nr:sigma 54-interacting transcriptional regulator [Deltaproteobacteria bacterium]
MNSFGLDYLTWGLGNEEILSQIFDKFTVGVTFVNGDSEIVYYNQAQAEIDDAEPAEAIGKSLGSLYWVKDKTDHPALLALANRRAVVNEPCFYWTRKGKLVNSLQNAYPVWKDGALLGVMSFISEYGKLEEYQSFMQNEGLSLRTAESPGVVPLGQVITQDKTMLMNLEVIAKSADSPAPTLVSGEAGTGKDMFARAIHLISRRKEGPYLALSCAAFPPNLLDGMLFGISEGAFSGAEEKMGILERATGGTLFLEDVKALPEKIQNRLLKALHDGEVKRLGEGGSSYPIDFKLVAGLKCGPLEALARGGLKSELLEAIGVVRLALPPLRDRLVDVPLLTRHYIQKMNERLNRRIDTISEQMKEAFIRHDWPGNVRELVNALEGAMSLVAPGETFLGTSHFSSTFFEDVVKKHLNATTPMDWGVPAAPEPPRSSRSFSSASEAERLAAALEASGGNAAKAARSLKISPQLMNYKLKKFCLKKRITVRVEQ